MSNLEKVSFCGIYCGNCNNYKQNANCQGCRNEKEMLEDCPSRKCTIEREFTHCGECEIFPCDMISEFYEDGIPMHENAYKNILRIKEIGIENFVKEQETLKNEK